MRRLATLAVVVVSAWMSSTAASGQYTFGDWASDQGYSPGDVMPEKVDAAARGSVPRIDSLDGIGDFNWSSTPAKYLWLHDNQISSVEHSDFSELRDLRALYLNGNKISSIESSDFSELTNLVGLQLRGNQISSIESDAFAELTNLEWLILAFNPLQSIESDDFRGLVNLELLDLGSQILSIEKGAFRDLGNLAVLSMGGDTAMTDLNLEGANFSSLTSFEVGGGSIFRVSLVNAVLNQTSLARLLDGGVRYFILIGYMEVTGIGELDGITKMDLSEIDFINITDLSPLYVMDDLTDLWLVDSRNLDATGLDVLLDNLETIEGTDTEGILYMTQADFDAFSTAGGGLLDAWDAEPGHHVAFVSEPLLGDVNLDGEVNGLDVDPFVDVLLSGPYQQEADMNEDQVVNGLDVDDFVTAVVDGNAEPIPEPSTLIFCIIALGVVGGLRRVS